MRIKILSILAVVAACSGDDSGTAHDGGIDGKGIDAPEIMPSITSFVATPSQVTAGTPTPVTFTWTYATEPTFPDPACTIDNGVGPVTKGQTVPITISTVTTFTLTCINNAGTAQRQVVIGVPPVAPLLATFTVSPTSVAPNTATPLTFTWTYSNTPSPAPTCTIDGDVGAVTSGVAVSMTLPQARAFRLKCTNTQGTVYSGITPADVTVAVNECGTAAAQCDAHATCTDTTNGYTCACNSGYSGNGDTCSLLAACGTTPALCDASATCVGGAQCICNAGYFGSGAAGDCTRGRFTFVTSTTGTGLLSSWTGAGANAGLAAADAVCQARAAAATPTALPGTYVAWMSDSTNDAYCRVHGLLGKKGNNCGLGALPSTAGPWVRVGDYKQWAPRIDSLVANHVTYYPANTNENGAEITATTERVWTGTDDTGQYIANANCGDWSSNSAGLFGGAGEVHGGGTSWTHTSATDPTCSFAYHLRCVEVSSTTPATLPPRHPLGTKKAFVTSVSGTGNFASWPDASGVTGSAAGNAICQSRARYAGYANPTTFKAWIAYYPYYVTNFITNTASPYARPDGVQLGSTRADMLDSKLAAAWEETETNAYLSGNADAGSVWTGMYSSGSYYYSGTSYPCLSWTYASSGYIGATGRFDMLDSRALQSSTSQSLGCDTSQRLYCVED